MFKQYIVAMIISIFAVVFSFSNGNTANAATSVHQPNTIETTKSAITTVSKPTNHIKKETASSNDAEFVQDTLPQTGVEANHSGLYFSIAGFFLLLAVFTSRSKSSGRYTVSSDKHKK